MNLVSGCGLVAGALALEAIVGYPRSVLRTLGHPVMWIGALIELTETRLNVSHTAPMLQRLSGIVSLIFWLTSVGAVGVFISWSCGSTLVGGVILIVLASSLLSQRALHDHVRAVAIALQYEGLTAGRVAVSQIVGRATADLDEAGVARAAIESLAENFSDGVVAPAFWLAIGGLAGGLLYKTINTADSMVGHRTPRYVNFGWASARFDDLVNFPASRLSALLFVSAAAFDRQASASMAWRSAWRDAHKHQSPNAGWPEAAMAGALDLKLGGPRVYEGMSVEGAFLGDGRRAATFVDIYRALRLFERAAALQLFVYAVLALAITWRA